MNRDYKTKSLPTQNVSVEEMQNSIGGIQNQLMQAAIAAASEWDPTGGGGGFANSSRYGYYTPEILVEATRLGIFENLHGIDSLGYELLKSGPSGKKAMEMYQQYELQKLLNKFIDLF